MSKKISKLLEKAKADREESSITSAEKTLLSEREAGEVFSLLKTKLQTINQWNEHGLLSSYELFDEQGKNLGTDELFVGVFVRIWLKGSGKYDWVKVIDIIENENEFVITVKPTFDPTAENPEKDVISHFFTDASTNNFCLLRDFKTVSFYVIGLDEKRNTTKTDNALETARNLAVKLSSYLGVQKSEWEKFTESFLNSAFDDVRSERNKSQ